MPDMPRLDYALRAAIERVLLDEGILTPEKAYSVAFKDPLITVALNNIGTAVNYHSSPNPLQTYRNRTSKLLLERRMK